MKQSFFKEKLDALKDQDLFRQMNVVDGPQGRKITVKGKDVLNFCSNDYLGLASDPRLKDAAKQSLDKEGFGAGASRLVCGNLSAHRELEQQLARLKKTERAVVFSTGYMANVGIISGLFDRSDIIFCDRLNHASIIDGIVLSRATCRRYPHNDMAALEQMVKMAEGFRQKVIITDTVFSMDGDIAPLPQIVQIARKYNCLVMVDEAHAAGVLGATGSGAVEHFGLEEKVDIQMGTLSKAAGAFGAFCCGSEEMIDLLINRSRSLVYTTGMPPNVAAAALEGLKIIQDEPQRREKLMGLAARLRRGLGDLGFNTGQSETPIIPVVVKESKTALEFSARLFEHGIFVSAIRPPTVPPGTARLRITVTAAHTEEDVETLLNTMERIGKDLCLS